MQSVKSASHAALYTRAGVEDSADGGMSLGFQEKALTRYCELRGLRPTFVLREEGTGAGVPLEKRDEGAKLLNLINKGRVKHIVTLKLDRLWQTSEEGMAALKDWNRRGIGLHIVDLQGQSVDTGRAAGWYFLFQLLGFAEFERRHITERATAGKRCKKRDKLQYHNRPIFGFEIVNGKLEPNIHEQLVVKRMKWMRRLGMSYAKIADKLSEDRITTKRGGKRWYASTIRQILNNELHDYE